MDSNNMSLGPLDDNGKAFTPPTSPKMPSLRVIRKSRSSLSKSKAILSDGPRRAKSFHRGPTQLPDPRDRFTNSTTYTLAVEPHHVVPYLATSPRTTRLCHAFQMMAPPLSNGSQPFNEVLEPDADIRAERIWNATILSLPQHVSLSSLTHLQSRPERVLDAPGLDDNMLSNPVAWSEDDITAVALERGVFTVPAVADTTSIVCEWERKGPETPRSVAYSLNLPGGRLLAIGLRSGTTLTKVSRTDPPSHTSYLAPRAYGAAITVAWAGNLLASGYESGDFTLWDIRRKPRDAVRMVDYQREGWARERAVLAMQWNASETILACGRNDKSVHLWDVRMLGKKMPSNGQFEPLANWTHTGGVKGMDWCPWQPSVLAYGSMDRGGDITFRSAATGEIQASIPLHSQVTSMHFYAPSREVVITTGTSKLLSKWRSKSKTPREGQSTSLAYITRPLANRAQQPTRRPSQAEDLGPPPSNAIVTYRYPSLQRLVAVPTVHVAPIVAGILSPSKTMLLTASSETLQYRTIWGQRPPEAETTLGEDTGLIR